MEIDRQIVGNLETINWFSNCAIMPDTDFGFVVEWIPDWSIAVKQLATHNWEDTTLQARNALTMHLSKKYQNEYQHWNKLTKQARDHIVKNIMPTVTEFQQELKLPSVFCDRVRWDLLATVMEASYKSCAPPVFFANLFKVYSVGRYPCGWKGEWPNGSLMVI